MDITNILVLIITIVSGALITYAIPYLITKFGADKVSLAYSIIKILVQAVEQVTTVTGAGARKKAEVMEKFKEYNITLDEKKVSDLIESAVLELNEKVGK